ncbi:Cof-type HAD-IIB family hydrolase [Thomasclavelia sp.]|uniref:Cof-type HAD-IIB family hydrolase n=1 Tax=Thomasclavelia sp. TaxID=3025757 RepID=UPI0025EEA85A|nr:Cof-type HAD-IIB family hydrolase [Thomasclavelia sp.]
MEKKIIFFDVDGTLVAGVDGVEYVPESTKKAIALTRAKGNLVYLCTGRSKAEIYDFILECGIDGVIGAGGGYVEIGDQMLYHKKVTKEAVNHMIDYFEANHFDYYVESNGGLFASKNLVKRLERIIYGDIENDPEARKRWENKENHFINAMIEGQDLKRDDINKACFLENPDIPFDDIIKEFEGEFNVIHCTVPIFGDDSGELSVPNIHKANAIEALISHLGIDRKNTYAFGDGMNDKEMLEYVNVGIAVGNAKEGLKAIADEVTDDITNDGIYNSMKKHNLI